MNGRLVFAVSVILILLGIAATSSLADPPDTLANPPIHQHWIVQPDGTRVQVGPRLCDQPDNPAIRQAFNEFHNNLHIAGLLGPAAPGLHNSVGAEIIGTPGCH